MITPEIKDAMTRFGGNCARKNTKKCMVSITDKRSPIYHINEGFIAVIRSTLAEPIAPKTRILAVETKR